MLFEVVYYARDFSDLIELLAWRNWSTRRTYLRHFVRFLVLLLSGELEGGGDVLQDALSFTYNTRSRYGTIHFSDPQTLRTYIPKQQLMTNFELLEITNLGRCSLRDAGTPYSAHPITETPAIRAQATICLAALASPLSGHVLRHCIFAYVTLP